MAGHSKWKGIKHKKAIADAQRDAVKTDEDIRAGKFFAVMRYDVSFKVLHEAACVKAINIRN